MPSQPPPPSPSDGGGRFSHRPSGRSTQRGGGRGGKKNLRSTPPRAGGRGGRRGGGRGSASASGRSGGRGLIGGGGRGNRGGRKVGGGRGNRSPTVRILARPLSPLPSDDVDGQEVEENDGKQIVPDLSDQDVLIAFGQLLRQNHAPARELHQSVSSSSIPQELFVSRARKMINTHSNSVTINSTNECSMLVTPPTINEDGKKDLIDERNDNNGGGSSSSSTQFMKLLGKLEHQQKYQEQLQQEQKQQQKQLHHFQQHQQQQAQNLQHHQYQQHYQKPHQRQEHDIGRPILTSSSTQMQMMESTVGTVQQQQSLPCMPPGLSQNPPPQGASGLPLAPPSLPHGGLFSRWGRDEDGLRGHIDNFTANMSAGYPSTSLSQQQHFHYGSHLPPYPALAGVLPQSPYRHPPFPLSFSPYAPTSAPFSKDSVQPILAVGGTLDTDYHVNQFHSRALNGRSEMGEGAIVGENIGVNDDLLSSLPPTPAVGRRSTKLSFLASLRHCGEDEEALTVVQTQTGEHSGKKELEPNLIAVSDTNLDELRLTPQPLEDSVNYNKIGDILEKKEEKMEDKKDIGIEENLRSGVTSAIKDNVKAAHKKSEYKPKRITRNQPGTLHVVPSRKFFRPRQEVSAQLVFPLEFLQSRLDKLSKNLTSFEDDSTENAGGAPSVSHAGRSPHGPIPTRPEVPPRPVLRDMLNTLSIGLFRRGVASNANSIVAKEIDSFPVNQEGPNIRCNVQFYAPRSPGTFTFRLYYADEPVQVLASGPSFRVQVRGNDLEPGLRFILSQFRAKKMSSAAMHQLASIFRDLKCSDNSTPSSSSPGRHWNGNPAQQQQQQQQELAGAGRAAYGCLCEARKVLEGAEIDHKKTVDKLNSDIEGLQEKHLLAKEEEQAEIKEKLAAFRIERASCDRKKNDTEFSFASILKAIVTNQNVQALLRSNQVHQYNTHYQLWCPLLQTFAHRSSRENLESFKLEREKMQIERLGFVPNFMALDALRLTDFVSLTESCKLLFSQVSPNPRFFHDREHIRLRVLEIVKCCESMPRETEVAVFGSSANGFGTGASDLDMCIKLPPHQRALDDPPAAMGKLAEDLELAGMLSLVARLTARIPIILFEDHETQMDCDISMENPLAVHNTQLLGTYSKIDRRVRELGYVVKKWAKARNINNPSDGTLSSYGYILMIIHFLQRRSSPVIPNLQRLKSDGKPVCKNDKVPLIPFKHPTEKDFMVNAYFYNPTDEGSMQSLQNDAQRNKESIGVLFAAFFRYYAIEFNYRQHVISINSPGMVEKDFKAEVDCWPVRNNLSIEDPFETFYDVAHVVKTSKFHHIREEFALAYTKIVSSGYPKHLVSHNNIPKANLMDIICEDISVSLNDDKINNLS
mmetsp:Transcript_16883/g.33597  ORF Transcript_16883/g.33597 Transcript_16883/m.33597 type:complete len:1369 (+) Transcript_16883:220-4326(+)|eukprot:CAMPEP_0194315588 /NCGR_PEP_ID=MMETSP0171-20130528/12391_1 /TAXON_ID=218684 /ORGANISM="Corethron pennatum, Strain L29A3" /LENGTH=1368 /DNA_ID=CAMNT_0039071465 /DNA_START=135 /DNA_END=4241 /DNA_ORIENTATION=-